MLLTMLGWPGAWGRGQEPTGAEPTFAVTDAALGQHVTVIAYGDMRFHDPSNVTVANPAARKMLVNRIAEERPAAVQLTGDVPYKGSDAADYANYKVESAPWRDAGLRVYPAMGNHELSGGEAQGVENWWAAFPELRGRRWYSVALGSRIWMVQLDSTSDLRDGSPQRAWLETQLKSMPKLVDFVLIGLHHPPVADIQTRIEVDHNPRPNEIALRDYLTGVQPKMHAQIVVTAGHIHNYERAEVGGVTYLVSGGGGAKPYEVDRTAQDLYQDKDFPNFHYVRFELGKNELKATMFRLGDAAAATLVWQEKDHFTVKRR
ncbi:MAG: hypothetical protein NVSMB3_09800 [Acidobacteriaceae bacterium]